MFKDPYLLLILSCAASNVIGKACKEDKTTIKSAKGKKIQKIIFSLCQFVFLFSSFALLAILFKPFIDEIVASYQSGMLTLFAIVFFTIAFIVWNTAFWVTVYKIKDGVFKVILLLVLLVIAVISLVIFITKNF